MHGSSELRGHTVLFLHAHPDDEAIFTGITMRRLADAGARVVLVLATSGDLGESRVALAPGETVAQRRVRELERSAELLGVSRLVLLGRRDSGLPGWDTGSHPRALAAADTRALAVEVADLAVAERAETLVYDDESGIYGHPDHAAVHRIGAEAARLAGAASYQVTVDRDHLDRGAPDGHLVHGAARAASVGFGRGGEEIHLSLVGSAAELAGKHAAITAHASQIDQKQLPTEVFGTTYGTEWFRHDGAPGLLDLYAEPAMIQPRQRITRPKTLTSSVVEVIAFPHDLHRS